MNVWTEGVAPPVDCLIGGTVGHQSSCGFINYVDFTLPVQRITACLGSHKDRAGSGACNIIGLKFDFQGRPSTLLGRCTALGSTIEFDAYDRIAEVHIGLKKDGKADVVQEIIFHSRRGSCKGFREGNILIKTGTPESIRLSPSEGMSLVGMTWAFDFGFSPGGDHGIQPLYRIHPAPMPASNMDALYSTLPWAEAPPPGLQLRPALAKEEIRASLSSSLSWADSLEDFRDTDIVSIVVIFNAFLQGITIHYRNGQTRAIGNPVGATDTIQLKHERIFAVAMRERRQQITQSQLSPGDLLCIEAIQVSNSSIISP